MKTWYVYMIECRNGSLYTGITTDVKRRFAEHQKKSAKYTSYNPPVKVVYTEKACTRSTASKREAAIKKLTRKQKLGLAGS